MKKYKNYIYEKYNREIIENEYGFIDYEIFDDGSIYLHTLYVLPEFRDATASKGKELEELVIAKEKPWVVYCDIDKESSRWEQVLFLFIRLKKYKVHQDFDNRVVLYKEL